MHKLHYKSTKQNTIRASKNTNPEQAQIARGKININKEAFAIIDT
jgi:hypothetical protein